MEEQLELFARFTDDQQDKAEQQIVTQQRIADYEVREYPIEVLIQKYKSDEIFIPKYQRKYVWSKKKASKFIESILLGLPIPYLFLADAPHSDGASEIVDGSQRIRTLEYFIENELVLVNLEKLTALEGFRFIDLPLSRQRRFLKKTIRLIELTDKADIIVRKDLFERINTTPEPLSDMEIRKGVYEGTFYDFIDSCSKNIKFLILCPISDERIERDERLELVLRFFAYTNNYTKFIHEVKDFLDEYMKEKNKSFDKPLMEEDFENMLDFVDKYFPYGFKKTINHKSTPRVRFEAIAVGVGLALKEKSNLTGDRNQILKWLNSPEFKHHTTSDAANNKSKVTGRMEFVRDKLLGKI